MTIAAFIVWIGQQAITYAKFRYGAGRHITDVPNEDVIMLKTVRAKTPDIHAFVITEKLVSTRGEALLSVHAALDQICLPAILPSSPVSD